MEKDSYIQLLDRFLQGFATQEEIEILQNWIRQPEAREICNTYYHTYWEQAEDTMETGLQEIMVDEIRMKIENSSVNQPPARKTILQSNPFRYIAAACILLVIGISLYFTHKRENTVEWVSMVVQNGQKAELTLPDGTIAYMNSGTQLKYNTAYNKKVRNLFLEGEAYFEVAKDKKRPFSVHANGIQVDALGTSFNVKANTNEETVSVILIEGKVKVHTESNEEYLLPNERVEYNLKNKSFQKSELHPNANLLLWRSDELNLYGESLEQICHTLTRMYNVDFIFTSEEVKEYTYRGIIKNNSLKNVLDFLSQTAPVKYQIYPDNTIIIEKK
ncbi:MAG: FecR family protein [Tannerellaceae bacterium]|nr:FecR family protein [Tannerellaceae bacterium]